MTPTLAAGSVRPDADARATMLLLQLLARQHGLPFDTDQALNEFAPDGQALSPQALLEILHCVGLEANHSGGKLAALGQSALPVLSWDHSGALLLIGKIGADGVTLVRAGATEPQQAALADFEASWSGRWIAVSRVSGAARVGQPDMVAGFGLPWFWKAMRKYKGLLGEVLLASFFVQIFALLTPLVFQVVIDKVLTHRSLNTLDVMVIALVGFSIFEVVLATMRHYLFSHTTGRIDAELGRGLFRHLIRLPLSYFESRRSGDTVARMRELENARSFMTGQALTSWLDLLFAVVFLGVMFYYSVTLSLMVLAALPVFFGASWLMTPLLRRKLEDKFALGADNQSFLVETVTSMETLKSHAVELQWQREWERRQSDFSRQSFQSGLLAQASSQFTALASKLLTALLLYFGALQVMDGALTVGGLIAFNMLAGRVNAPILKLASLWQEFTQMKVSVKRLGDIMDAPAEPAFRPGRATPPDVEGRITLDHVTFRYTPQGPEVLSDVSLDIAPGEIIGVVGVSGAGKTTLMRLFQRLYTPERGRVLIDGMNLNLVDASWLRRQMGVVGQDTVLFNRSVRDNIAFANPGLDMAAVMEAAKLAGAHDFILELPEGYDTLVGERGGRLSGGQRSRIAIARALATEPKILLFDEATAALDYESERVIQEHMARIAQGRTVIVVAHRLSTLQLASRIVVFDNGRLVEQGSHHALLRQQGRYAALHRKHQLPEAA
jgi:subfamily B ATP-binding cassette protein HlyB/CyaB